MSLHDVQEQALMEAVTPADQAEVGMPSVYSCIYAACEFLENWGFGQAGISLLSDDCLAHILSFLATSRETIDEIICVALPIFEAASKNEYSLEAAVLTRLGRKMGYIQKQWRHALSDSKKQYNQHFWMQAYNEEEEDVKRNFLIVMN